MTIESRELAREKMREKQVSANTDLYPSAEERASYSSGVVAPFVFVGRAFMQNPAVKAMVQVRSQVLTRRI